MERERVVVGMSGGVDSAVAAALLVEQGYEVVGVTMRLWTEPRPSALRGKQQCCSVEDIPDARRVAAQLGIRHYVLNFERQFREHVVDPFLSEYVNGRTPNPCVRCNEHIKYRALLDRLQVFDARWLATGHYARVIHSPQGGHRLLRGRDRAKDQSYVLYMLRQDQLGRILLPLGDLTKEEVRARAAALGLEVAAKPESQEICFVPGNDYRQFVAARVAQRPGELRDQEGRVLGRHAGIAGFTVGQRHGLGIAAGEPLYVTDIDPLTNVVTLGDATALLADTVEVSGLTWVSGRPPGSAREIMAQARYRARAAAARLVSVDENRATIRFETPQRALAPGQALCLYEGEAVLGGGTISRASRRGSGLPAEISFPL